LSHHRLFQLSSHLHYTLRMALLIREFRKRADEIAKQGRTPTDAQAYSDTAASAESGKLQMGWEMRDLVLLKKTLEDFAWKELLEATVGAKEGINSLIEKIKGLGGAASEAFNEFLDNLSKSPGRNNARKWLGMDEPDGGIEKMSYPGMLMDRGMLQTAAVGQMMMASMSGGMPGAGGMMHAAFSGMPSGGRSGGGGGQRSSGLGGGRTGGKVGDLGGGQAWLDYLNKLEAISNLEIMAQCYGEDGRLHVFGRTPRYFTRSKKKPRTCYCACHNTS
jgi:hypothetical protein